MAKGGAVRIWQISEDCAYEGMALAVATIRTPASWRVVKSRAWICHAGEAMRGLFPNLPESIEGPWGALPRDEVFGAADACSAMLDAMEGLAMGGEVDAAFETGVFETGSQPLVERVGEGKLELDGILPGDLSVTSHAAWIHVKPHRAFFVGERAAALAKMDAALDAIGGKIMAWMPCAVQLGDPSSLAKPEAQLAMALARRAQFAREARDPKPSKAPKGRL